LFGLRGFGTRLTTGGTGFVSLRLRGGGLVKFRAHGLRRFVQLLAGGRGRLSARPVRHRGEETQGPGGETVSGLRTDEPIVVCSSWLPPVAYQASSFGSRAEGASAAQRPGNPVRPAFDI